MKFKELSKKTKIFLISTLVVVAAVVAGFALKDTPVVNNIKDNIKKVINAKSNKPFASINYDETDEEGYWEATASSIKDFLADDSIKNGYYKLTVSDETYTIHMYVYEGNQVWSSDQIFGDENDVAHLKEGLDSTNRSVISNYNRENVDKAKNSVMVKVKGNLTVNEGVKVTSYVQSFTASKYTASYGGAKGLFLYVDGNLTNNGEISMSARGAYADGQNVYLTQNSDGTYETVPAEGARGGLVGEVAMKVKNSNIAGKGRQTGGGAAHYNTSASGYTIGAGGAGTSYSGGTGGGKSATSYSAYPQGWNGSSDGGNGGLGSTTDKGSSGAGNPGNPGHNSQNGSGVGEDGTGGLLVVYSNSISGNGKYSSLGARGGVYNANTGGDSGCGSINIFLTSKSMPLGYNSYLENLDAANMFSVSGTVAPVKYSGSSSSYQMYGGDGTYNFDVIAENGDALNLLSEDEEEIEKIKEELLTQAEKNYTTKTGDSIYDILKDDSLESGYYIFKVGTEVYYTHLYVLDGNQVWNENQTFGDLNDVANAARTSVMVKVKGNLTINSGATVTAYSTEYGGPKGLFIYATGAFTNYGTVTMSKKGAHAEGDDVVLYKNEDGTTEKVDKVGGDPVYRQNLTVDGEISTSTGRQTGGGSTALTDNDFQKGGKGTSYSGGSGGSNCPSSGNYMCSNTTSNYGGASGGGKAVSAFVGAGNPKGLTTASSTYLGENGTGGLLTIYANTYTNEGTISADGANGSGISTGTASGNDAGGSGGGSVNIFINDTTSISNFVANSGYPASKLYNEATINSLAELYKGTITVNGGGNGIIEGQRYHASAGNINVGTINTKQYADIKTSVEKAIDDYLKDSMFEGKSIYDILKNNDLSSGYYIFKVDDKRYFVHLYTLEGNQTWNENQTFGDANDVGTETEYASNTVIVKVKGNLTINEGVKVTAYSTEYGGPKGMFIYTTGKLTNYGEISMTAKGAYAEGEDVYLFDNNDETMETVPAIGGEGGAENTGAYNTGTSGTGRQTGGGSAGRGSGSSSYGTKGGNGTSYSGGTGGSTDVSSSNKNQEGYYGSDVGGAGGKTTSSRGGSGAGNPAGTVTSSTAGYKAENGTGGLLTIYADTYENLGSITANGSNGGKAYYHAGGSGGGSINIFVNSFTIDMVGTNYDRIYESIKGETSVQGGQLGSTTYYAGSGTVNIGSIGTGKYIPLSDQIETKVSVNNVTNRISGTSIIDIVSKEDLSTGYYYLDVNNKSYVAHVIVLDGNQTFSSNRLFGNGYEQVQMALMHLQW